MANENTAAEMSPEQLQNEAVEIAMALKESGFKLPVEEEAPAEEAAPSEESIQASLSEKEQAAWDKGWRPQELFTGPEGKWVDAETFLDREPFFARIAELNQSVRGRDKELAALKRAVETLTELNKTAYTKGYEEARTSLLEQRKAAFQEGDLDQFDAVDRKLKALDDEAKAVNTLTVAEDEEPEAVTKEEAPAQPSFSQDAVKVFDSWVGSNPWYGKNDLATELANAYGQKVSQQLGDIPDHEKTKKVLAAVDAEMVKRFPELYRNSARAKAPRVGGSGNVGAGNKDSVVANLTPLERKIMRDLVANGTFISEEAYLEAYSNTSKK